MGDWAGALERFLATTAPLSLEWMLVGSAATAVHGATVAPGDIDVLVHPTVSEADLGPLAQALLPHAANASPGQDLDVALSTAARPWYSSADGGWLLGRWIAEGCRVEAARITQHLETRAIVETHGRPVWGVREVVTWRSQRVPVVPLEVQLATLLAREYSGRIEAVTARLSERGFDAALLERACQGRNVSVPRCLIQASG